MPFSLFRILIFLHLKSENFLLTFRKKLSQKIPPLLAGGDEGEGDLMLFVHPHPLPPPSKGEEVEEISNIFG
jgi:hypothetical protein